MNTCLEKIKIGEISDDSIAKMKENFSKSMRLAGKIFEDDAFRKRESESDKKRPINKAYFEVIAVAFANLSKIDCDRLVTNKDCFKRLLMDEMRNNKSYNNSFSNGTGKRESVRLRFSKFNEIIGKALKQNN